MKLVSPKNFWQIFISFTILISGLALIQTALQLRSLGISFRSKWSLLLILFALNILLGIYALTQLAREDSPRWLDFFSAERINRPLSAILIPVGFALFWIFKFLIFADVLPQIAPIFWVFLWGTLIQTLGLKFFGGYKFYSAFAFLVVLQGLLYQIYGQFTAVSAYPFSIGYSEASRHYYASLFHAKSLYDLSLPYPFLHPTRYMLLSLPYFISGLPLWFHRLWQVLLWIVLTGASSLLFARRLQLKGWLFFFVAAWAYVYFLQGAVYYHLQVCVILILAGVSAKKFWQSLIFVVLASFWAGMSRVNWFPVPAMLAITIYLLENAVNDKGWHYWMTPVIWGIMGLVTAIVGQFFYIQISGNADIRDFGSSFTSDLLWNRLLPNDIFSGVLLGLVLVSTPLIISLFQKIRGRVANIHPLRWLALLGLVLILFAGGLVVSVKIGGGGDLHNTDAFLVLMALIATAFFTSKVEAEDGKISALGEVQSWVMLAALLVPISYAIPRVGFFYQYDSSAAQKDLQTLQQHVAQAKGEILFVTERQLLTFGELKNIPLVPEYEQIELMEMAMSHNRDYLEKFYADLNKHRFALLIAEEQKFTLQKTGAFKEENNAWVKYIGAPILCAYRPIASLTTTNIQIYVPRPNSNCKDPFLK